MGHTIHSPFGLEGWKLPLREQDYLIQLKKSREDIDAAIKIEQAEGMTINVIIKKGDPIETITDIVKKEGIDLFVMLAHREGHLEHFLFGRCNEELVRTMPCSIFLVKKEPADFGEVD